MAFKAYQDAFTHLLDNNSSVNLLLEKDYPFAHEAGVYIPARDQIFITSNRLRDENGEPHVEISKITISRPDNTASCEVVENTSISMSNGGVNYKSNILVCAQGSMTSPSGLYSLEIDPPYKTELLVADFYGRPFNSVNDVVVSKDGAIWFTDPTYGHEQGYRPRPCLPSLVYRYDPCTNNIRAMADAFGHPNGLCFCPDESVLYVTDTDRVRGDGTIDDHKASTIYAFDISIYSGQPFLINRRVFVVADNGIPDGIKCDLDGNVYSGCGDGIHVWSPGGILIGKILVEGGVANFCFGRRGEIFAMNETRFWRIQLAAFVRGALLKI